MILTADNPRGPAYENESLIVLKSCNIYKCTVPEISGRNTLYVTFDVKNSKKKNILIDRNQLQVYRLLCFIANFLDILL